MVLPGDGIGPEVIAEAVEVLRGVTARAGVGLVIEELPVGGAAIDACGEPLPGTTLEAARRAGAVLLGAVGSPRHETLPRASRPERVRGTDMMIVRELTGGIYFGRPRGIRGKGAGRVARNSMVYSAREIRRIARVAFELARGRRRRVTSVDKANILEVSQLWREVVTATGRDYPDVRLDHLYVDNAAMQIIARPRDFDVILTENLFGDILSDEAAMLAGGIGMLPSASLGKGPGLYEPVHGSAPDIAGRGVANPLAAILSVAMLLRHSLALPGEAARIETAVASVLDEGARTADLARPGDGVLSTREMGRRVRETLERVAAA